MEVIRFFLRHEKLEATEGWHLDQAILQGRADVVESLLERGEDIDHFPRTCYILRTGRYRAAAAQQLRKRKFEGR